MWSSRWNEIWRGKPKYSEKSCASATLSMTNPTSPDLGSNSGAALESQRVTGWAMVRTWYECRCKSASLCFVFLCKPCVAVIPEIFSNLYNFTLTQYIYFEYFALHVSTTKGYHQVLQLCIPLLNCNVYIYIYIPVLLNFVCDLLI
jgi:hypothetical protein